MNRCRDLISFHASLNAFLIDLITALGLFGYFLVLEVGDSGNDSISITDGGIVGRLVEANISNISETFRSKDRLSGVSEKDKNNGNSNSREH